MNILSLDIGKKRTGVAFATSKDRVAVSLQTIEHESIDSLKEAIDDVIQSKSIECIVVGPRNV